LLADITSKYQQGDRKGQIKEDGCASDPISKQVEGIEIVELQLSHVKDLFHCEKCNCSFKLFYHFNMKSHSTESFKCEICNKRYLRESAWKQHLNCYHLEEGGVRNELRRHLSDTHNILEHLVTEEVLSVETRVQTEPVTSMTIIEQVRKLHVLLQVQVDSAQVTVEQVHPDLLQDSQVHNSHMSELPEQVQVSYLEVGQIQTEEGTEVHVEELHVEWVNQMPVEVQTELLEVDLDHVTPEIMSQEEREPNQADAAEAAREDHRGADGLKTKSAVDSQVEK
ncbi:Hypothetical predicted protein, partial [Marmota monax]